MRASRFLVSCVCSLLLFAGTAGCAAGAECGDQLGGDRPAGDSQPQRAGLGDYVTNPAGRWCNWPSTTR